jgi:hypothetical protein
MDGLAEAYAIAEKLREAQGLAHVGRLYGQLLCAAGQEERGMAVLAPRAVAWPGLAPSFSARRHHDKMPVCPRGVY